MLWLLSLPVLSLALDSLLIQTDGVSWDNVETLSVNTFLKTLEEWDVVEVMKFTGHGEGLDEERTIQIFGEEHPIVYAFRNCALSLVNFARIA